MQSYHSCRIGIKSGSIVGGVDDSNAILEVENVEEPDGENGDAEVWQGKMYREVRKWNMWLCWRWNQLGLVQGGQVASSLYDVSR